MSAVYPQSYDEKYKVWRLEDLPILPDPWRYDVTKDKQKQFGILKKLMNSKDVTELICATDSGREGELIFRLVYHQAGCTKPFKRLWTSSLEDQAIWEGMQILKDSSTFDNLYHSADARDKADWLIGMNLSRLLSALYRGKLAVGRVKTPTLAMIAQRDAAIREFQKEKLYTADLAFDGFKVSSEKQTDREDAQRIAELMRDQTVMVKAVVSEQKTVQPPKLYDLTTLQRECNRLLGYTAQQTLDIAQSLYESKLITYPRTDSQYLTEDMQDTALSVISSVYRKKLFPEHAEIPQSPNLAPLLDNSKVSDHYAIIPTGKIETAELYAFPKEQQKVLTLIAGKLLLAVSAPHVYESTKITLVYEGAEFTATGKTIIDNGFKALERIVQDRKEQEKTVVLPPLKEGERLNVLSVAVTEHATAPPKPFTEDSLLSAMERAGNAEYESGTEKKGIGTPATRAGIMEGLIKDGYIERTKNALTATKAGHDLISVVPDSICSPKLTADWESKLQAIERGECTAAAFLQEIADLIKQLIQQYGDQKDTINTGLFQQKRESLGACPRCGGAVVFGGVHKNYYCENRDCRFALWENNKFFASLGKTITKPIVQDFLSKGESFVKGFVSAKNGKSFDAAVMMKDTGTWINFELRFNDNKKGDLQ